MAPRTGPVGWAKIKEIEGRIEKIEQRFLFIDDIEAAQQGVKEVLGKLKALNELLKGAANRE
jgi:hypothetical protein